MTEEEKKTITQENILAASLKVINLKKRKEEILHIKEQSTVQSTGQYLVKSTLQSTVQSTDQPSVQLNDTYIYGVGILAVLAIGVCVFFTFQPKNKKPVNKKNGSTTKKTSYALRKIYTING